MKKLTKNEIILRIVSVILGTFLWYVVLNTSNPIITKNITVPLEILNEDELGRNSLGLINQNTIDNVTVTVKGRKNDIDKMISDSIVAYADYSDLTKQGDSILDINIYNKDDNISVDTYEPKALELTVDEIIEKSFNIEVVVVGEPAAGYKLISVITDPEQISVKAFKSDIDAIDSVVVQFDAANIDKSKSLTKYLQFLNNKGEEIMLFSKTETVNLDVTIGKQVTVNTVVEGTPAEGYYFDSVTTNANYLYITGPFDVVSKISEVKTRPINIEGISENMMFEIEPSLANNIQVVSVDGELSAMVIINKYKEKTLIYRKGDVLLTGADHLNYVYDVVTDPIEIKIKGKISTIDSISKADINIYMDTANLLPGLYELPLYFDSTTNVEIIGDYTATLSISDRPQETSTVTETTAQ
jgi:YbbR domain-containing protein